MQKLAGNSSQHLEFFLNKIKNKEPFAVIRPNDAEYMILQGEHFTSIDSCKYGNVGEMREELSLSISYAATLKESYIGIPCHECWTKEKTDWYIKTYKIDSDHLTYGNLVCNKNWLNLIQFFINNKIPINYIGPGKENTNTLNITSRFYIEPFLVHDWDKRKSEVLAEMEKYMKEHSNGGLFCFSAGPLSKIFIPYFYTKYPNCSFMDVGSAFDVFLKGSTNRHFVLKDHKDSKIVCSFESGHSTA